MAWVHMICLALDLLNAATVTSDSMLYSCDREGWRNIAHMRS